MEFFFDIEVVLNEHGVAQLGQQLAHCLETAYICRVIGGGILEVVVES